MYIITDDKRWLCQIVSQKIVLSLLTNSRASLFLVPPQKVCSKIGKDVIFDKNMYEIQLSVIKIFSIKLTDIRIVKCEIVFIH